MKKNLILLLICLFALPLFSFFVSKKQVEPIKSIQVGNVVLNNIGIADTNTERELGLSGRVSIDDNFGLLFVFERPGIYGFWMKDMNFPIDIIWLDEDFVVVGLKSHATPESYPQIFYPEGLASYVLETNQGLIESTKLKIGERFKVSK